MRYNDKTSIAKKWRELLFVFLCELCFAVDNLFKVSAGLKFSLQLERHSEYNEESLLR